MRWPASGDDQSVAGRCPSRKLIVELFVEGTHNNECDGSNPNGEEKEDRILRQSRLFDTWGNETPATLTDRHTLE